MAFFPMMVSTENQNVIVIGGGEEGLKKIRILRSFGALITLVAPDALPEAIQLSNVFHKKKFSSEDLEVQDYMLVVSATNDREVKSF
ncbi:MAG: NAD(P)-dependent oxidoreductase [Eubacterium sp.]|nr:NAD(P)-dependent oxidoreductase [Eubacterium sp.]